MKVTAKINSLCNHQVLKANAQLEFDKCFTIKGVKVCQGEKGLYVTMPAEKMPGKDENSKPEYRDIAFPTTKEARAAITKLVLEKYEIALEASKDNEIVTIGCYEFENDYVEYWVRNPNFISEEVQNSIFKRAFSTKGKDRGLGTYSMKLLGEKYLKGSVGFTSSKAEGTCFYIKIPKENFDKKVH